MKFFIVLLATFYSMIAVADRGFATKAVAHANGAMMASPPLPLIGEKIGKSSLTVRPVYFKASDGGNSGPNGGGELQSSVDYSGMGMALSISTNWNSVFDPYVAVTANKLSGNFSSQFGGISVQALGAESSLVQGTVGLSMTFFKKSILPLQLFGGPSIVHTSLEQRVTSNQNDDFIMTMNPTTLSYLVGAQFLIKLGESFAINPYFVTSDFLNEDDKCQKFETQVTSFGPFWDLGDPKCQDGENSSTQKIEYDTSFSIFGVNLQLPKIGLTINVFAQVNDIQGFEGADLKMYSISFTF